MQQHTMQEAAEGLLQRAGIADAISDIGMFRRDLPSERTGDWILSDLAGDAQRGQARGDDQSRSSGGDQPVPADQVCQPRVFLGSGDRGVYGFGAERGDRLPSSLLFALDAATVSLKVRRGLLSTVVVLSAAADRDDIVLRGNRFGRTGAAAAIASIRRLISARAPQEA